MLKNKRIWLRNLREINDMRHQDVADIWGIHRTYYTLIENGERNPSVSLAKVAGRMFKFDWTLFFK